MKIRRLADHAAGAIVATALLAGGAAYAAGADDRPSANPTADDHVAVAVAAGTTDDGARSTVSIGRTDDRPATRSSGTEDRAPGAPTTDDRSGARTSGTDDHPRGADDAARAGAGVAPSTVPSTTTAPPVGATTTAARPAAEVRTASCADGSATIARQADVLTLVAAAPAGGWSAEVRHAGPAEIDVRFIKGDRSCRLKGEIEDGSVRLRAEER